MPRGLKLNHKNAELTSMLLRFLAGNIPTPTKEIVQSARKLEKSLKRLSSGKASVGLRGMDRGVQKEIRDPRSLQALNAHDMGIPLRGRQLTDIARSPQQLDYDPFVGPQRALRDVDAMEYLAAQVQNAAATKRLGAVTRAKVRTSTTAKRVPASVKARLTQELTAAKDRAARGDMSGLEAGQEAQERLFKGAIQPNENSVEKLRKVLMDPEQAKNLPPALKKEMMRVIDDHDRLVDKWGDAADDFDIFSDPENF